MISLVLIMSELNSMPQSFNSVVEALMTFMRILSTAKESLKKIFIRGEYNEYPDDKEMHCSTHLAEMLNWYSDELQGKGERENEPAFNFLVEEIQILEEANEKPSPAHLNSKQGDEWKRT
ncbi:hypothetical protein Ancab_021441 [Ancistrocladus abbreviatus]